MPRDTSPLYMSWFYGRCYLHFGEECPKLGPAKIPGYARYRIPPAAPSSGRRGDSAQGVAKGAWSVTSTARVSSRKVWAIWVRWGARGDVFFGSSDRIAKLHKRRAADSRAAHFHTPGEFGARRHLSLNAEIPARRPER